jgi:hypothetical protein
MLAGIEDDAQIGLLPLFLAYTFPHMSPLDLPSNRRMLTPI